MDYWEVIRDAYDAVDTYNGHRTFRSGFRKYPESVQHLLAAHWCQSEVCNGGFEQFFHNSTGVLGREAKAGFAALGDPELARIVGTAVDRFGWRYPTNRTSRQRKMKSRRFDDLNQPFYDALDRLGGFNRLANQFASRHIKQE